MCQLARVRHPSIRVEVARAHTVNRGGTLVNMMIFNTPAASDFDDWKQPGWSFDELLPYMKKVCRPVGRVAWAHGLRSRRRTWTILAICTAETGRCRFHMAGKGLCFFAVHAES